MQKKAQSSSDTSEDELDVFARQSRLLTLITPDKIREILDSSYIAAGIVNYYEKNGKFSTSKEQDHITEILVDKLLTTSANGWKNEHYKVIAKSDVKIFMNKSSGTYYEPRISKSSVNLISIGSGGKIPDRFNNLTHYRNKLDGETRSRQAKRAPSAKKPRIEGDMNKL